MFDTILVLLRTLDFMLGGAYKVTVSWLVALSVKSSTGVQTYVCILLLSLSLAAHGVMIVVLPTHWSILQDM